MCLKAHAAEIIAPHGPPAAVPEAISATAFPPSTPALTVAAATFAVALAPSETTVLVADLVTSFAAVAICLAAPA